MLITSGGVGFRKVIEVFRDTFGLPVEEAATGSASTWIPKVRQERQAGVYSFDVALVPSNSALSLLKPEGAWATLRPLLFRPDITDDKFWRNGINGRFMDTDKTLAFSYSYDVTDAFAVNTDLVKPEEIRTVKDLLDPKWRGKMAFHDVRIGTTGQAMRSIRRNLGEDVVKQLLVDQQPTFTRDVRQPAEWVVRGRFPIVLGSRPADLKEFRDQGLAKNVKFLSLPDAAYVPGSCALLFSKAPHPNAAKLLINWLLTQEGQTVIGKATPSNKIGRASCRERV